MYFSLVSPLDPNPKYKSYRHLKPHHELICVIDLEAVQESLEFYHTENGSVPWYDTVSAEILNNIINIEDGSERFENIKQQMTMRHRRRKAGTIIVNRVKLQAKKSKEEEEEEDALQTTCELDG